jgi:methylated-DNA-[protein]-cysteine S-methyltransferase
MSERGFALFDTAIGVCGLAWAAEAVTASQLPEGQADAARRRLKRRSGAGEAAPPPGMARHIQAITALLATGRGDLSAIPLDTDAIGEFERAVYEAARRIPAGSTRTYGELAAEAANPRAARAVGVAMAGNPFPIIVPCHRVLAAGGGFGGFSARGGLAAKARLLQIERASTSEAPMLFEALPVALRPKGSG